MRCRRRLCRRRLVKNFRSISVSITTSRTTLTTPYPGVAALAVPEARFEIDPVVVCSWETPVAIQASRADSDILSLSGVRKSAARGFIARLTHPQAVRRK